MAKKTPALNTSSTADIAFLLLCYFLMTTTMGTQTGLQRRLPPMPDPNQKVEDQKVNKRNLGVCDSADSRCYDYTDPDPYDGFRIICYCDTYSEDNCESRSYSDDNVAPADKCIYCISKIPCARQIHGNANF